MTSSLGNVISRLQGLKNVSKRKVMPGTEYLQDLEAGPPDVTATAPEEVVPENPPMNMPEPDLGGMLSPQSYDVRANTITTPESNNGFWNNFAQDLKHGVIPQFSRTVAQTPPVETAQVQEAEGLPPVTASEQEESGLMSRLGKFLWPTPSLSPQATIPQATNDFEVAPQFANQFPEAAKNSPVIQQQLAQQEAVRQDKADKARENPLSNVKYGATDAFANSPELVQEFNNYTGINFDEEKKLLTEKYEKVLDNLTKGYEANDLSLDEQAQRINQRILNNHATDADKFYIGLALTMPLLVGGLFGSEAGLGALSGGAQGFANVLGNRESGIREDEKLLAGINKERRANASEKGKLEIERMKIPIEVAKQMPSEEYEDLKNAKILSFKDPKTGEIVASGPEILPDFVADLSYGNTPEKRKEMRKEAVELGKEKAVIDRLGKGVSNAVKAAQQLPNAGILGTILAYALSEEKNGSLKKIARQMSPDVIIDGRRQNAAVYIDSQLEPIKDAIRINQGLRAYTDAVVNHVGGIIENPQYSGLEPKDLIDQLVNLNDRAQNLFVDKSTAQGFLKEPLVQKFGKENRKLFKGLNRKEEVTQTGKEKLNLAAGE